MEKARELKKSGKTVEDVKAVAPIRGKTVLAEKSASKDGAGDGGATAKTDKAIKRDKTAVPTYYKQWDKYDVDGEVAKVE